MTSGRSRPEMHTGEPNYHLPLDFETILLYSTRGSRRGETIFSRMYPVPEDIGDLERLAAAINEESPEAAQAAREIRDAFEELAKRHPDYR